MTRPHTVSTLLRVAFQIAWLIMALTAVGWAQVPVPAQPAAPFQIVDNSFLVEEAFNQEAGIFQNIFSFRRSADRVWNASFTQEWPVGGIRHQFSYTLAFEGDGVTHGIGDAFINYRLQVLGGSSGRLALAPRLSLIVNGRDKAEGLKSGTMGLQVNLPLSKQLGDVYLHWNVGFTRMAGSGIHKTVPALGISSIWRAKPMFHPLVEVLAESDEGTTVTVSPGFRTGLNFGDKQVVVGFAVPIEMNASNTRTAAFAYFSYELPF